MSTQHNVYEVTEEVYRSCDTGGGGDGDGVRAKYTSGYDRVVLAEARGHWFICDVPGHCQGGMRVAVNVSAGAAGGGGGSGGPPMTVNPRRRTAARRRRRQPKVAWVGLGRRRVWLSGSWR